MTVTTPSGIEIEFDEDAHRYRVNGEKYPSVTGLLGQVIDKSGGLVPWAVKEVREGRDPMDTRDDAAARGTSIHDALEVLATDGTPPLLDQFPEEHRGYVQGLCRWWLKYRPVPLLVEQIVASVVHRFAGKLDLVCLIDGVSHLVDLKTSKAVRGEMHLQTAAYSLALKEGGWTVPEVRAILRVGEDGTFEFVCHTEITHEEIALGPAWYEAVKKARRKPKKVAA